MRNVPCLFCAIVFVAALAGCQTVPAPSALPAPEAMPFLHAQADRIVNKNSEPVQLSGCNIGGWLLLEPWVPGLDNQAGFGTEKEMWDVLGERFGKEKKLELIKTYRENFFNESDVERIAAMGMNCLRIPIWWRAVTDSDYGGDIGYLDRCIEWCARNGVYVIIDLQGAPGGQCNESANVGEPSGGDLWQKQSYKDRTVEWWKMIAERYKDNPTVAAYDLLNEGFSVPRYEDLVGLYDRLYKEIRKIDSRHMLVMEDIWGFHHLPRPENMSWQNVVYSFHYYPRGLKSFEEAVEVDATVLHRFNRTALYDGVPIYVGEFSPIDANHGGADSFLKYREVCEYFGWAWTFWTYKKIEENDNIVWAPYAYYKSKPTPVIATDSFEKIKRDFELFATSNSNPHPLIPAALRSPLRWEPDPVPADGTLILSLRKAYVVAGDSGYLRYEWGWTPPNLGYWTKGDSLGWKITAPKDGAYELGLRLGNNSNTNSAGVWLDGVHIADLPIQNANGWRNFQDRNLGVIHLTKGAHTLEITQADDAKGFINLRQGWLRPTQADSVTPDEEAIWLTPFNMSSLPPKSPIRVEWLNNPPNISSWNAGQQVSWKFTLQKAGSYKVMANYATANDDATFDLAIDGKAALSNPSVSTGDWQKYSVRELGGLELPPGEHTLTLTWNVSRSTDAGNLRDLRLEKVTHDAPEK